VSGASLPWVSGRQHKNDMSRSAVVSGMVLLIRDHGHGRVTIDAAGNPVHEYPFTDATDQRTFRHGLRQLCILHEAAGAQEIVTLHRKKLAWTRGEDLAAFADRVHHAPLTPYDHATFSLHHMGSARMGRDPMTSVADPWGQLHGTPGVWIGDASAFPTASGTNPMLTTMALAHRTAEAILAAF
jgi:choline dehydrogenase-like flavoprotein